MRHTNRLLALLAVGSLVLVGLPAAASAAMIQIELGGVDLAYDGSTITGVDSPDPLTNVTFFDDETKVGVRDDDTYGVSMDLDIPDVYDIPVGGGQVTSATDGTLYLNLGGGDFLSLLLDEVTVAYVPLTQSVRFVFAGSAAELVGQQLPFDLTIAEPISVSFSTNVREWSSDDDEYLSFFRSKGTGEITGIPEPATMGLLGIGGLALMLRRKRS